MANVLIQKKIGNSPPQTRPAPGLTKKIYIFCWKVHFFFSFFFVEILLSSSLCCWWTSWPPPDNPQAANPIYIHIPRQTWIRSHLIDIDLRGPTELTLTDSTEFPPPQITTLSSSFCHPKSYKNKKKIQMSSRCTTNLALTQDHFSTWSSLFLLVNVGKVCMMALGQATYVSELL